MIFWLEDELFSAPALRDVDRIALLRNLAARHHTLIISAAPGWSRGPQPAFRRWLTSLNESLRQELELLVQRAARVPARVLSRGASRVQVQLRPEHRAGVWCVDLPTAVRTAALPLFILVKNGIHDAAFLRRVMPPVWRRRLLQWEERGELRFEHGGSVAHMLSMVQHFASDQLWCSTRLLVWAHDGSEPAEPEPDSQKLREAVAAAGLAERAHMLWRRRQESYLPAEALQAIDLATGGKARQHSKQSRHFADLHKRYKNRFAEPLGWQDEWFARDGSWPEMVGLAEKIAAAI